MLVPPCEQYPDEWQRRICFARMQVRGAVMNAGIPTPPAPAFPIGTPPPVPLHPIIQQLLDELDREVPRAEVLVNIISDVEVSSRLSPALQLQLSRAVTSMVTGLGMANADALLTQNLQIQAAILQRNGQQDEATQLRGIADFIESRPPGGRTSAS